MKYTLGLDFGSLSGRAVLVEVETGNIVATAVLDYPHAVMDEQLPCGKQLAPDWALQHPKDYLDVIDTTIPSVLKESGVAPADVIGLGIDFTACTVMPVAKDGEVLCMKPEFANNPHAYVKLWKHHAAQCDADQLNQTAEAMGQEWLKRYGGKISSEWAIPKLMQVVREAPEIYEATDQWLEATDWIILQLTGELVRSNCTAGYKSIWHKQEGFPQNEFFVALNPALDGVIEKKYNSPIKSLGECAGRMTQAMADKLGLSAGLPIAVGNVDAHVAVPAVGINQAGDLLMIMGTSTCDIMLGEGEKMVPGICGYVEDGVLPGMIGYEAGQSCVGDHFNWCVETITPPQYYDEAKQAGVTIHDLLTQKASKLKVGESGLIALDWWNGNRSVLVDVDLTGLLLGMTLLTKPEEIYRALIEATAYGARTIVENFNQYDVPVKRIFACGGIAEKNAFLMQIYADVLGCDITIADSKQTVALGSAMFGAVAAGKAQGGYETIFEAIDVMSKVKPVPYKPNAQNHAVYEKLFNEYTLLHDYFGRGGNDVMKRLKAIKAEAKECIQN